MEIRTHKHSGTCPFPFPHSVGCNAAEISVTGGTPDSEGRGFDPR